MIKRFIKFCSKRKQEWEDGNKLSSILKTLGAIICIILGIIAWSIALRHIVEYVRENLDWIVFSIIVGILIICGIKICIPREVTTLPSTTEHVIKRPKVSPELVTNYELLCSNLFNILPTLADILHIIPAEYKTQLHSENPFIRQGMAILLEYIVHKSGSAVTTEFVKAALSDEFLRNCKLGRIEGISNPYYYFEGIPVPLIQVHSVIDCGAFYRVRLAIANDDYCRHMRNIMSANLALEAKAIDAPTDKDFS